jgi:hypothetical protein
MGSTERPAWLRLLARGREDDPRVAHDLDLLAAAYGPGAVARPDRTTAVAHDLRLLASTYGRGTATTGEGTGVGRDEVLTHLRRYRVLYGLALVVLAVVVLADPVPGPGGGFAGADTLAPFASGADSGVASPELVPSVESPVFGVPSEFGFPESSDEVPEISLPVLPPPSASTSDDGDVPLRITSSGYASVFGGTPLEQPPPEEGLPVAATAGNVTKMSFIRLSGTAPLLRLAPAEGTGANLNETSAAIKACRITETWEPERGIGTADAPSYDAENCVLANVVDGVWTFDLAGQADRGGTNGFALVPGIAAADTFQVTFRPTAA